MALAEDARLLGQRQRTLLLMAQQETWASALVSVLLALKSHWSKAVGPGGCCACSGLATQMRNAEVKDYGVFLVSCKQTCSLSQREKLLYPSSLLTVNPTMSDGIGKEWSELCILGIPNKKYRDTHSPW